MKIVLQIWENFVEGEVVPSGANVEAKQQEVLKVCWNVGYYFTTNSTSDPSVLMRNDLIHYHTFIGNCYRSLGRW
jgi:hypothetical protein